MSLYAMRYLVSYLAETAQQEQGWDTFYDRAFAIREEELFAQRGY